MTAFKAKLLTVIAASAAIVSVSTSAQAETTVRISDLNTATAEGRAAFDARVDQAARRFCNARRSTASRVTEFRDCVAAVQVEMNEKLAAVQPVEARAFAAR